MVKLSIVLALTAVFGLIPLLLTLRFGRQLRRLTAQVVSLPSGTAAVIVPCKGIDQGFDDNILAILDQDFQALQIIFVVATEDDPARAAILRLVKTHPARARCTVAVAGVVDRRAQKLTNQLHGLSLVGIETVFLAFLDSDLRPDPGFIGRLLAPLSLDEVGACTGFRWYHPPSPAIGSMLRSTWNAGALPLLTHPSTAFAYGGAMAIRRSTFEKASIATAWDGALSDDFPFTRGVKSLGLELRFVPTCIAVSYESSSIASTLEFTNRQSIISRVYYPKLWVGAAIHSTSSLLLLAGLAGALAGAAMPSSGWGTMAVLLLLLPLQALNALVLLAHAHSLLPALKGSLDRLRWHYVLCAPLASLLSLVNTISSLMTNQIVWRGIRYELLSPTRTRVLGSG